MSSNATYASDTPLTVALRDALPAGALAAVVSGVPSTTYTLATGGDLREGALAAGSILLPREQRPWRLLAAAAPVHLALSFGWAVALAATLPRRWTVPAAVAGALGIAALDLEVIGRRFPRVRALPQPPQWGDHVAYGLAVGFVVRARRRGRSAQTGASASPAAQASARSTDRVS
jgi:hypothetical protein